MRKVLLQVKCNLRRERPQTAARARLDLLAPVAAAAVWQLINLAQEYSAFHPSFRFGGGWLAGWLAHPRGYPSQAVAGCCRLRPDWCSSTSRVGLRDRPSPPRSVPRTLCASPCLYQQGKSSPWAELSSAWQREQLFSRFPGRPTAEGTRNVPLLIRPVPAPVPPRTALTASLSPSRAVNGAPAVIGLSGLWFALVLQDRNCRSAQGWTITQEMHSGIYPVFSSGAGSEDARVVLGFSLWERRRVWDCGQLPDRYYPRRSGSGTTVTELSGLDDRRE
ncbi:hypothetical protein SKAU_G00111250 [Synaphobranchus kaupii]|uniref:Uncharacterized protein n=1 Tax=Synaphobranchus kaupii TaxID=118154 RepID=A0A9Q1G0S0_SYNKA|nr:hypothetical protein SKAU_G00111250 [Synaphobranchus kaupii]